MAALVRTDEEEEALSELQKVAKLLALLPDTSETSHIECAMADTGEVCGRRLQAACPIRQGEIVMSIPVCCMVTVEAFDSLLTFSEGEPSVIAFETEETLKKQILLLLHGCTPMVDDSPILKAYITTLPALDSFHHHPIHWDRPRVSRFGPMFAPVLMSYVDRLENEINSVHEELSVTIDSLCTSHPRLYSVGSKRIFTKKWLTWAICCLNSRSYDATGAFEDTDEKRKGLVPVFDLANHAPTKQSANVQFGYETIGNTRSLCVRAARDIEVGEELLYQYQRDGESEMLHFLFYYGFVPLNLPLEDDLVYYEVELVPEDRAGEVDEESKIDLLMAASESLGFPPTHKLVIPASVGHSLPSSLLWAYRLHAIYNTTGSEEQLFSFANGTVEMRVEQEQQAWTNMGIYLQSCASWYSKELVALNDDKEGYVDRAALRRVYKVCLKVVGEAFERLKSARAQSVTTADPAEDEESQGVSVQGVFDVGSGATKCHIAVMEQRRIVQSLLSEQTEVLLRHDLELSPDGLLSDEILSRCENVLLAYKRKGEDMGVTEWNGVATAVFRKAKNGGAFLKRIYEEHGIPIGIVDQKTEGRLGFLTASAVNDEVDLPENLIAWDLGGGSFQMTDCETNVFEGPYGSTHALSTACKLKSIQFSPSATPNPYTKEEFDLLVEQLRKDVARVPCEGEGRVVVSRLSDTGDDKKETTVMCIGGETCAFRMCAMLVKFAESCRRGKDCEVDESKLHSGNPWSPDELYTFACEYLLGKEDQYLHDERLFPQANMVLPKIALVIAVMQVCRIKKAVYRQTNGNTEGMLLY